MAEVGTECRLYIDWPRGLTPVEGDFMRSHPGGSCYRIEALTRSRREDGMTRTYMRVTRLGKDAVEEGAEGVWLFSWKKR